MNHRWWLLIFALALAWSFSLVRLPWWKWVQHSTMVSAVLYAVKSSVLINAVHPVNYCTNIAKFRSTSMPSCILCCVLALHHLTTTRSTYNKFYYTHGLHMGWPNSKCSKMDLVASVYPNTIHHRWEALKWYGVNHTSAIGRFILFALVEEIGTGIASV